MEREKPLLISTCVSDKSRFGDRGEERDAATVEMCQVVVLRKMNGQWLTLVATEAIVVAYAVGRLQAMKTAHVRRWC